MLGRRGIWMSKFVRSVAEKAPLFGKCVPRGPLLGLNTLEYSFSQDGPITEEQVLFAVSTLPTIGDELYKQAFMQSIPVGEWLLAPPEQGSTFQQYQRYAKLLRDNVKDEQLLDKLCILLDGILDFTKEVRRGS